MSAFTQMLLLIKISFFLVLCRISVSNGETYQLPDDGFMDGQMTLIVEDNLESDGLEFSPRSTIQIKSIKTGNAVITQTRKWTPNHLKKLKEMTKQSDFYRIRVYQSNSGENKHVSTFTRSCQVYESGLSETISVMLDGGGSSIIGVSLFTPVAVCSDAQDLPFSSQNYNSTVIIRSPTLAPVPDTATYIEKMEAIKTEKAEGKDNRSFLAKYWMYIVPIVLFVLISGGGQEGGR